MSTLWPYMKIILGVIFLICCFTLPFLLFFLGLSKKKLDIYFQQVKKTGHITKKVDNLITAFDLLLITHVFDPIPEKNKYPDFYNQIQIQCLAKNISVLTKIVKSLAIIFGLITVVLITLLNIYET